MLRPDGRTRAHELTCVRGVCMCMHVRVCVGGGTLPTHRGHPATLHQVHRHAARPRGACCEPGQHAVQPARGGVRGSAPEPGRHGDQGPRRQGRATNCLARRPWQRLRVQRRIRCACSALVRARHPPEAARRPGLHTNASHMMCTGLWQLTCTAAVATHARARTLLSALSLSLCHFGQRAWLAAWAGSIGACHWVVSLGHARWPCQARLLDRATPCTWATQSMLPCCNATHTPPALRVATCAELLSCWAHECNRCPRRTAG